MVSSPPGPRPPARSPKAATAYERERMRVWQPAPPRFPARGETAERFPSPDDNRSDDRAKTPASKEHNAGAVFGALFGRCLPGQNR